MNMKFSTISTLAPEMQTGQCTLFHFLKLMTNSFILLTSKERLLPWRQAVKLSISFLYSAASLFEIRPTTRCHYMVCTLMVPNHFIAENIHFSHKLKQACLHAQIYIVIKNLPLNNLPLLHACLISAFIHIASSNQVLTNSNCHHFKVNL